MDVIRNILLGFLFNKAFLNRFEGEKRSYAKKINHLMGKVAVSTLIACLFWINIQDLLLENAKGPKKQRIQ